MAIYIPGASTPAAEFDGYAVGNWINPVEAALGGAATLIPNAAAGIPFIVRRSVLIGGLGGRVASGLTGANVAFAVYDSVNVSPNNPLGSTASLSAATSNQNISDTAIASFLLLPGRLYWWFVNSDSAITMQSINAQASPMSSLCGASNINSLFQGSSTTAIHRQYALGFGTWTNLSAASFTIVNAARNAAPALLISAFG
jgi:hypothetical protein